MALRAGLARLYARTRMHTHTRPSTHMHAHACTHTSLSKTYCFSTATMIRERASRLRYTYIALLLKCCLSNAEDGTQNDIP